MCGNDVLHVPPCAATDVPHVAPCAATHVPHVPPCPGTDVPHVAPCAANVPHVPQRLREAVLRAQAQKQMVLEVALVLTPVLDDRWIEAELHGLCLCLWLCLVLVPDLLGLDQMLCERQSSSSFPPSP